MSEYQSSSCDGVPRGETETIWAAPEGRPAPPPPPARSAVWSPPPAEGWTGAPPAPPAGGWTGALPEPPAGPGPRFLLTPPALVALGAMLLGTVAELSFSSYREVNGVQTECTYVNLSPLLFGPVAVVAGLIALVRSGRPGRHKALERGLGLLAVCVGVIHVLGGLNLFGGVTLTLAGNGPC